jgi:hypothetical protein
MHAHYRPDGAVNGENEIRCYQAGLWEILDAVLDPGVSG